MGSKAEAKSLMAKAGIAVIPGYGGERQEPDFLKQKAYETGYPVLIKAVAGGGGRGMRRIDRARDFEAGLAAARREAAAAFGDDRMLVERWIDTPRHIEVQIFADSHGNAVHLFERDCSVQRRHQKVVEEAPAPGLGSEMRAAIGEAAVKAALAVGYRGAGTVEFIADGSRALTSDRFFFMEMNTRLQVEHPVTEALTGLDLVEWQLRIAAGERLPLAQAAVPLRGHAIEARIYAEDPGSDFRPATGRIWTVSFPSGAGIRVDSGVAEGTVVGPHYDSLLAKVICWGKDRAEARGRLADALDKTRIVGPTTNIAFLSGILAHPEFAAGGVDTGFVGRALHDLAGPAPEPGLAAGAILEWLRREAARLAAATPGPWSRADAFQIGGLPRRAPLTLEIDGAPETAEIAWTESGPELLSLGGQAPAEAMDAEVVWGGAEAFVVRGGRQIRVGFPDTRFPRNTSHAAGGEVKAPMPGRVTSIAVAPGQTIVKGEVLFTLEAMKMEHSVLAPVAGEVREVLVAPGAQVEQGAPAISIRAAELPGADPVE
jgi:3-methylcrotonyl-CoA carboxylase alpha subunit